MRYLNELEYSQPQSTYAGEAVQEVKGLNEAMSNEYNETRQNKDLLDLAANNLDVRDIDYATKKQAIDDIKNQFKDLVANGNYQDANFKVRDAFKKFSMDKTLQGIQQSKKLQDAYQKDMQDKLAKNIIGKEAYNYGMTKTNEANQTPYSFDEQTGDEKGLFSGYKIHDDKTKEIYELMDKRIKDWKETGSTYANGQKYEVKNIGGVEKYFKNGVEVDYDEVQNALKTEIENTTDYADFMKQQREIGTYQRFGKEPITRDKLSEFTDDNIKTLTTGVSPKDISNAETQLADMEKTAKTASEKAAVIKTKAAIQEMKDKYSNVNVNDSDVLSSAYDKYLKKDQLNKFTSPAATKADYQKDEYKLFKDDAALEEIKARHAKGLEKYKKELEQVNLPIINNYSKEFIDAQDFETYNKTIETLENDANAKKAILDQTPKGTTLYNQRLNDYNTALSAANQAKVGTEDLYSNLTPETTKKLQDRTKGMFIQDEGATSNWDYRVSSKGLEDLITIAKNTKDNKTLAKLLVVKDYFNKGQELNREWAEDLSKLLTKKEYLPTINSIDNERVKRSTTGNAGSIITKKDASGFTQEGMDNELGMLGGALLHHTGLASSISDIMQTEMEKNQVNRVRKDVFMIPDAGEKQNSKEANIYHGVARTFIKNAATDLTNEFNQNLAEIESSNNFYHLDKTKDGKVEKVPANIDPSKTIVSPAPGGKGNYIGVTYFDKDGNKLSYGDEDKSENTTIYVKAGNPQAAKDLYKLAAKVAETTGQGQEYLKLKGEADFGETFRPMNKALGTTTEPFLLNNPDGTQQWVKFKQVQGSEEASYLIDANSGKSLINKNGVPKQYRNIDDVIVDMEYNLYKQESK